MNTKTVIFDLRGLPDAQLAAARVAGLPALDRTMLALQRRDDGGGDGRSEALYEQAVLLVPPDEMAGLNRTVGKNPRIKMDLCWIEDDSSSLDMVLESGALGPRASALLYWPGNLTFGRFIPQLARGEAPAAGALVAEGDSGLALLSLEAIKRHQGEAVPQLLEALDAAGKVEYEELDQTPMLLREPQDPKLAEDALMVSLRKPVDGVVAKYDRYISLAISRPLMRLPIPPNLITVGAGLVGIICGLVAAQGTYLTMLLGALGFQLNSILDGIDGEIARAKLLESRTGQWMDTISDDLSNLFFCVGATIGCYRYWESEIYLVLAVVTTVGLLITGVLQYHYLITVVHGGDLNKFRMPWEVEPEGDGPAPTPGLAARILARLKFTVRRDTFCFLSTVSAVVGQLRFMVWFYAIGATVVWVSILVYNVVLPRFRRKQSAAQ